MANLEQIDKYLRKRKLPFKIVDLEQEAFTVRDVVGAGVNLDDVVKTLIIRTNDSFVGLALKGSDRVNFKKIRAKFGSKSELARSEEVLKVVGVPVGAVCPVLVGVPLYIDEKVMSLKNVHMGSGDLKHGLEMRLSHLLIAVGNYQLENFSI